ncbi:hypothetical protein, partial [Streptococcus pseudopneumoniae]|uniref:hypothetical protein n=1 Tax=Streptococcus pseudopneumoniae TaxID=257758 RepID=UPI00148733E9
GIVRVEAGHCSSAWKLHLDLGHFGTGQYCRCASRVDLYQIPRRRSAEFYEQLKVVVLVQPIYLAEVLFQAAGQEQFRFESLVVTFSTYNEFYAVYP